MILFLFFCFFFFQYSIDDSLPFILNIFLAQAFGVAGTVVITCYGLPWFVLVLVPLVLVYYFIQNYYRRTSRYLELPVNAFQENYHRIIRAL